MDEQLIDNKIINEVYKWYRRGLSVSSTVERTKLSRKLITGLYFDWDKQIQEVKKEVQNPTPFSKISEALNTGKGHSGNFVLMLSSDPSQSELVRNAYLKMINK